MNERTIATNGVQLNVIEEGEGPAVVLCHGFPELARSWRHQIPLLVERGYKIYAPDMRGFGRSSRPSEIEAYDILELVADVIGLLDAAGEDDAIFIGHDWGATTVWHVALMHPGRVRAVVGMSVPHVRRAPEPPMQRLRSRFGDGFYQAWFQEVGPPDELLARDVRRTITAGEDWSEEWAHRADDPAVRPDWLSEEDLAVWAAALERTGLTSGLNYYRNIDRNWELTAHLDGRTIDQPALFITGSADIVRRFMPGRRMERLVTDLRGFHLVDRAGHWVQQERPAEVNALLGRFLAELED